MSDDFDDNDFGNDSNDYGNDDKRVEVDGAVKTPITRRSH